MCLGGVLELPNILTTAILDIGNMNRYIGKMPFGDRKSPPGADFWLIFKGTLGSPTNNVRDFVFDLYHFIPEKIVTFDGRCSEQLLRNIWQKGRLERS